MENNLKEEKEESLTAYCPFCQKGVGTTNKVFKKYITKFKREHGNHGN